MIKLIVFDLDQTLVTWRGDEPDLFPGCLSMLVSLAAIGCVKMAVASFNSNAFVVLHRLGILEYFDQVEYESLSERPPDSPLSDFKQAMLSRIVCAMGVQPEETLFFDDQSINVDCARRIGIHGVCVVGDSGVCLEDVEPWLA
jgi:FMN phosphatase YigB (HAD superfamily)